MVRVALIDPLGQHAGHHYYVDQLARGLTNAGVKVSVFTHSAEEDDFLDRPYEYIETFHEIYGSSPRAIRGFRFLISLLATFIGIAQRRSDIVHVHLFSHDVREILQIIGARLMRKKVVVSVHEIKGWSSRRSYVRKLISVMDFGVKSTTRRFRWIISHVDAIVVHNPHSFELLMSRYKCLTPIEVIPLPHVARADSGFILPDRASAREKLGLPSDKFIYLFFGNCRLEKGLDLALRAVAELKAFSENFLFITAGKMKPHEVAYFENLANELGLGDNLRMDVGLVSDEVAVDYFYAANAVVLPYREVAESGVAITASTHGRAIIASDLAPFLEATEDGRLGLHFRNGDIFDIARVMKLVMTLESELDEMGSQAKVKILRERDPMEIGIKMRDLYLKVLS